IWPGVPRSALIRSAGGASPAGAPTASAALCSRLIRWSAVGSASHSFRRRMNAAVRDSTDAPLLISSAPVVPRVRIGLGVYLTPLLRSGLYPSDHRDYFVKVVERLCAPVMRSWFAPASP